jgi:hypothetical protein
LLDRALYRVRQLVSALTADVTSTEVDAARKTLGEALFPLFDSMQVADQRHCLDVFERLLQGGGADVPMLQAALIHDCGKGALAGADIKLKDRVVYVALEPIPRAVDTLAPRWRGIAALRDHTVQTLALAREYGAPEELIALLEEMDGIRPAGQRGKALKRADDRS